MVTEKLLLATRSTLLALDGGLDAPLVECARFDPALLGEIRSVRVAFDAADRPLVLLGAQRGVFLQPLLAAEPEPEVYRLPGAPRGRGGVNAALLVGDRVYATHSAHGLVAWRRGATDEAMTVFDVTVEHADTVRAVQEDADGRVVFAAGARVLACDPTATRERASPIASVAAEVLALEARFGELVVGSRDGSLVVVRDGGREPLALASFAGHAVHSVRGVPLPGGTYYLAAARFEGLHATNASGAQATTYRAPRTLRWVDGGVAGLWAVDDTRRRVYRWAWSDRAAPRGHVELPASAEDICVVAV